jgi:hypothetical protein
MKNRLSLALIVGTLGVYFLVHACMAAYGIYLAYDILQRPVQSDDLYVSELRANYSTVVTGLIIFSVFGFFTVVSSIGLSRNAKWSQRFWLATSSAIVLCIVYAVVALEASWQSHYLYVLAVVGVSWWYLPLLRVSGRHES